jgi:hypothetical protein
MFLASEMAAGQAVSQGQEAQAPSHADIGYPTVADALAALHGRPVVQGLSSKEWSFFMDPESGAGWRFTLPGNPFHPSAIKFINCETRVLCEAAKNACERLIAEVRSNETNRPVCRTLLEADTHPVAPSPRDVKADARVTFNGPAKSCEVTAAGDLPRSMPCSAVVPYLTQILKLHRGAYVDQETTPDVDVREYDRVMAALKGAGYRPTPGVHTGFLTEPSH